jgi:hypothetical protein
LGDILGQIIETVKEAIREAQIADPEKPAQKRTDA